MSALPAAEAERILADLGAYLARDRGGAGGEGGKCGEGGGAGGKCGKCGEGGECEEGGAGPGHRGGGDGEKPGGGDGRECAGGEVEARGLEPFGDGHSGFTYLTEIVRGDGAPEAGVLRLSPPGARIAGPADVGRQGRIMRSLEAGAVPVPRVLACSSAPVVAGRAFMLLERVRGDGYASAGLADEALAAAATGVLTELRELEALADGQERVREDGDELANWTSLLELAPTAVRAAAEPLLAALADTAPDPLPPCRVHGDFHYGNLIFRDGRVAAVLDWEISSLGSPLWDLGSLIVASIRRRYGPEPNSMGDVAVGPSRLAELWGIDPALTRWHAAASCLKYAAIIGFNFELHRSGRREDPEYARLGETMRGLPGDGLAILREGFARFDQEG